MVRIELPGRVATRIPWRHHPAESKARRNRAQGRSPAECSIRRSHRIRARLSWMLDYRKLLQHLEVVESNNPECEQHCDVNHRARHEQREWLHVIAEQ